MRNSQKIWWGGAFTLCLAIGVGIQWLNPDPLADLSPPRKKNSADSQLVSSDSNTPSYTSPDDSHLFTGSESCRECHEDIYQSYSQMDMWHSFTSHAVVHPPAELANVQPVTIGKQANEVGSLQYVANYDERQQRHIERMINQQGDLIFELIQPIAYVIGSGARGYSYLLEDEGLMFQSPLTWYSQSEKWDLSPRYDKENFRFTRRITDGCLSCHVGRINADPIRENHFLKPHILEAGIGCERCHGPGQEHIQLHSANDSLKGEHDPIVNPSSLSDGKRASVCYQCHLSPDYRVLRAGRSHFDFRPGNPLSDTWVVFSIGTGIGKDGSTDAVNHVEQMHASECFQQSKSWFGCTSCHNPHQNPPQGQEEIYYRSRCLKCHQENETIDCSVVEQERLSVTSLDSCIHCHMPKLTASDVAHTSQTDHRILKRPLKQNTPSENSAGVLQLFSQMVGELTSASVTRAKMILEIPEIVRAKDRFRARELQVQIQSWLLENPPEESLVFGLGLLQRLQGAFVDAEKTFLQVLEFNSHSEIALQQLMEIYHLQERFEKGLEMADRLLASNPRLSSVWGRKAHMLGRLGKIEEGITAAKKSIDLDPSQLQVHAWLVGAYRSVNNNVMASEHAEMVKKLTPLND